MKKVSDNKIPGLSADWANDESNGLPYAGWAVQEFIKSYCQKTVDNENTKTGGVWLDTAEMKLYTFRSEEDKNLFLESGDVSGILSEQDVVFGGMLRRLSILNKMDSNNLYYTTGSKKAEITVGFESKEKEFNASYWTEVIEDARFTVSIDKGSTGNYTNMIENKLVLHGNTFTFDVFNYLASGANRVKVTAVGTVSEQTANYVYNVNVTSMYLSPSRFAWYLPFMEGKAYSLGGMNIGGALPKKLKIKVTGDGYSEQYEENIGTATYLTNPYYYTGLQFPDTGTGVYHVELWLDADGLLSDSLHYDIMCVSAADAGTAKLCCMANVAEQVTNYAESRLFDYAVYNGGSTTASPRITLEVQDGGNSTVLRDEVLEGVATGWPNTFLYNVEVETGSTDAQVAGTVTYGNTARSSSALDNSVSFPATAGASFYLSPAARSNSQADRERIVNETDKSEVSAQWTNMAWVDGTDGWTVDDEGRKCLLMPARTKADISLQPLHATGTGKTIEFTFKVANASDYKESVITVCDAPADPKFRGINIFPDRILLHSRDLNTDDANQSYRIPEDTLINVCISIIRNYKTNYGNICIIYVNGVRKKEFAFTTADSWLTDANLVLGSDTADLYLYNMRIYDKGFGTQDALQNYVASLPNAIDKAKAYELLYSVIDDSFRIDYDKTKSLANVVTIEMLGGAEIPHYGLSKEYKAQCNLHAFWHGHPEWDWGIDNITMEGQGTTSMNYFRWNFRWRLDKSKGFTVVFPDGTTSTEDTLWFDGEGNHPKLSRMTAKINYASSMQSHKMGATAMYNDVHHHLGLDNEAGGRVAVYQHPFYFFEKKKIEGTDQYTYEFIGLFTFGPDKGDKYTFGYKDASVKDTLLSMEGTDHSIKGVGMEYPYSGMKYVAEEESLCVDKGNNVYDAAWEVSQTGSAETEEEIQAKLDTEFKPAYEVAYNNSTLIIGTTETLETVNADPDAWGRRKDDDGHAYQRYDFWIDGEYELYFLSKKTGKYEKNGINLLTQLELTADDLSGLDIKAKNELFKAKRRERFKAEMGNYWHLDDCLYCWCFLLLVGATDNFKKNSYPYKLGTLESGSRWRWRQDDLDTLFDIDNQGLAVKGYSIEAHDWTDSSKTAYVFKGEDSVFWTLLGECFANEEKAMGKKILAAMYEMSDTGSTTIDRLMGFFQKYFWSKAQDYFTKSAYNADAEYKYEEAWPKYADGSYDVDVHPLSQSLGDHLEAEMLWVRQRLIYMMSKWGYGPFAQYTDTCLGRINFRTQLAQSFKLTPFMDLYPTILSGQGGTHASAERIPAGEETTISGAGGTNTNVYIMASDELEDIGDLSALTVDAASNATISVASKRLKRLKIGDETADRVTSNLQQLSVGQCNSLVSVDARNLALLTGTVDLSRCPRLVEALFGGTDVRAILLANGSKITRLQLSDSVTVLELMNLNKLTALEYQDLSRLEFFRVEHSVQAEPFATLKGIYNLDSNTLRNIRLIGFEHTGTSADLDMLAHFAEDKDKNGDPHPYNGIDADGTPSETLLPVIEGDLTIEGNAYEDSMNTVKGYFPNLNFVFNGEFYFRFADAEVNRIMATNFGDGVGVLNSSLPNITSIDRFSDNKVIKKFDELKLLKSYTPSNREFLNCTSIESVQLPDHIKYINPQMFYNCTNLKSVNIPGGIVSIGHEAFTGVPCEFVLDLSELTTLDSGAFRSSGIIEVKNTGKVKAIGSYDYNGNNAHFAYCKNLKKAVLNSNITTLLNVAFVGCTSLQEITWDKNAITSLGYNILEGCPAEVEVDFPNLNKMDASFMHSGVTRVLDLGNITTINSGNDYNANNACFYNCKKLTYVTLKDTITAMGNNIFSSCVNLVTFICHAAVPPSIGSNVFDNTHADLKIYVPDASVEAYKTATNWSTYANRIHPLSEYVEQ